MQLDQNKYSLRCLGSLCFVVLLFNIKEMKCKSCFVVFLFKYVNVYFDP